MLENIIFSSWAIGAGVFTSCIIYGVVKYIEDRKN